MIDRQADAAEFRSRLIVEALRIVATSPGPVTAGAVQNQCEATLNAKEEESAAEVSAALHLLCVSGLILSNRFDLSFQPTGSSASLTFAKDTTFVASQRLTGFIWREGSGDGDDA